MKIPKLPFDLPDLRGGLARIFDFSRREVVVVAVSVSALLVAALITTIVVMSASGRSTVSIRKIEAPAAKEFTGSIADRPFLSDFMIYEDTLEESFTGIIYSREPLESWSDEQIEKYWIDPRDIAADQLAKDAEKIIRDIFADVP